MIIKTISLRSFRAHQDTSLGFAPKVNLLYGPNGAGKTNVLEAIHYLCLSKSFLASQDLYALRRGERFFEIEGTFEGQRRPEVRVRLAFVKGEGKRLFVGGAALPRLADIVGRLPVVTYSPADQAITAEGPEERRRFLDNILSQSSPVYLEGLLRYRRALRQRNELLNRLRKRGGGASSLDAWDTELVTLGSDIIVRRLRFVETFKKHLTEAHRLTEGITEEPTIEYRTVAPLEAGAKREEVEAAFRARLSEVEQRERQRGRTLLGPHRDELVFRLAGMEVRRYASQGQHRTFGMALKLAQHFFLKEELEEDPLLLLDDVFDNLDARRAASILELLQTDAVGQSIITAARRAPFAEHVPLQEPEHGEWRVEAGQIEAGAVENL